MKFMSPDQVDDCAEYLSKRCESKSIVVKSKALRAIKTFCVKAPATFRSKMQRHSVVVRACTSHTGAPHPLRGDAPHKQVRDLANEAVRAIFDARSDNDAPTDGSVGRPLSGHPQPVASSSSGKNPNEAGAGSIIGDANALSSEGTPRLRKTTGTWGGEERREGFGLRDEYANRSDREESASFRASDPERFRLSAAAPSSDAFEPLSASVSSTTSSARKSAALTAESRGEVFAATAKNVFRLEGSEEGRRVDAACARGGVKLAPSAEVLKEFTRACEGLRPEGVAAALAAKFAAARSLGASEGAQDAADARQEAFKAACCLEACALSEGEGARSVARRFLSNTNAANEEAESLRALAEGAGGGALAEKAKKAAAAAAAAGGGGIPDAASVSSTVPAAATAGNRATFSEVDFFGLGNLATETSTTPGASLPPVPVPVPVPAASPAVDDLLGGLSLGGATAPTPALFSPPQIPTAFAQQQMMQQQMMQQQMMQQQMMQQQMMQQQMMMSHMSHMSSMSSPPNVAAASPSKTSMASSRNGNAAPGGQSAKNYAKDAKAFDFVSDLLGSEKKK
jgi:hypothetical protein